MKFDFFHSRYVRVESASLLAHPLRTLKTRLPALLTIVAAFIAVLTVGVGTAQAAACSVPSLSHPTIQSAVNDPGCNPINVAAGLYPEQVTISRTLTLNGAQANAYIAKVGAKQTAYLLDPSGKVGHLYGAKTTPHMFVIDKAGVLRYMGGIDSIKSTDQDDVAKATQYVTQALRELAAGTPVSVPTAEPYGCSVEYGS